MWYRCAAVLIPILENRQICASVLLRRAKSVRCDGAFRCVLHIHTKNDLSLQNLYFCQYLICSLFHPLPLPCLSIISYILSSYALSSFSRSHIKLCCQVLVPTVNMLYKSRRHFPQDIAHAPSESDRPTNLVLTVFHCDVIPVWLLGSEFQNRVSKNTHLEWIGCPIPFHHIALYQGSTLCPLSKIPCWASKISKCSNLLAQLGK